MRKLTAALFLLLAQAVIAQTTTRIYGIITDEQSRPLASATASLVFASDSSLVKLAVSDKEGRYEFAGIPAGEYRIMVTAVGFARAYSDKFNAGDQPVSMPVVSMTSASRSLAGVTVEARRPFVETKLDKTIVNVEASPTSVGASALEVLEKSPGVSVDSDGNISLRGKQGVIILVDGRQTYLSPSDLASMLRNMPASELDQLEIMTNPSSRYDASGNSGVINLKTKKGRSAGFNGSVMAGITSSIYQIGDRTYFLPKSQNSFNFNYRRKTFNFFGNYNPNLFRGRSQMHFDGRFLDGNMNTLGYNTNDTRFRMANENHTLKLGMDWYAGKRNIFGAVVSGFSFHGRPRPSTLANLYDENYQLESQLISTTQNDIRFRNLATNLNWKHIFDTAGRELNTDLDYIKYSNISDLLLTTDYYDGNLTHLSRTYLRGNLPTLIDIFTVKSDYSQPFLGGKLEAGFKLSFVSTDNEVLYERSFGGKFFHDSIRSNHFIYRENVNAGYVNFSRQIKKLTFQAGLRLENTHAEGDQVVTKTRFTRDTTNLFPTAFVSYALSRSHSLTASYGRRIQRPNYQDMNPFIFFLDTLSNRRGNIYLRPQYSHNLELTHAFRHRFITTLSFSQTDDVISQVIKPESDTSRIRFLTVENVATFRNAALSVTAPLRFTSWWNCNLFGNIYMNHYKGVFDTFAVDMSFTSFMVNITNSFNITKSFSAELSGFYRHRAIQNLSQMDPVYQLAVGLQKQMMKGRGTARLNIRDPFAWQRFEGLNRYGLIDGNFSFRPDMRQVAASFTWRFGKSNPNAQPRRRSTSSQDEQNRVGGAGQ